MNNRPLIFITNDDGIHAPGLEHLIRIAATFGDVVAGAPSLTPVGQVVGPYCQRAS